MTRKEQLAYAAELESAGWRVIPPEQNGIDYDRTFSDIWPRVLPYTLISPERAWALTEAIRYVVGRGLEGAVVECGVYRGGACLLAAEVLASLGETKKEIWLYDTFSGMTDPTDEDRIAVSGEPVENRDPRGWWTSSREEVEKILELSDYPRNRYRFVEGDVEETLGRQTPDRISVLRLDTDWYASTRIELEILYPKLVNGGVLLIDDFGHFTGARKAVVEYFSERNETVLYHRSDYTGRVVVKDS